MELLVVLNYKIVLTTLHFQGQEADAVILTTVRTKSMGFWSDNCRLNVAMTRARHALRIIGNVSAWETSTTCLSKLAHFY